jgi:CheY-like chemotaxis protein
MDYAVLIVEDNPDAQVLVSHIISYLNIECEVAGDGEIALQKLFATGNHYRAVILDLSLPLKDGWEVLREIRAHPATADLFCIAITAFHNSKIREQALQAGFNAYFTKPLDITKLARELQAIL